MRLKDFVCVVEVAIPFVIGAIFGQDSASTRWVFCQVAIPFVIGAIFGHHGFRSGLSCLDVAIPFVIGAIFGRICGA